MSDKDKLPPLNFAALADALLPRAADLVAAWLPGGVQRGHEYVCGSLAGGKGTSCSVNLNTGEWADFSGDEKGRAQELVRKQPKPVRQFYEKGYQ